MASLTVTFKVEEGDVWIDPDGTSWYVKDIIGDDIYVERTLVEAQDAKLFIRKWRKLGDPDG